MRINARLDEQHARELEYLKRVTQAGTSEVLKTAIRHYYREVKGARPAAGQILMQAGFVACGEADPDLSQNYKEVLTEGLEIKHDHR